MMPAAKHFDPVLGVDIHIIQPPGPVPPIPIPHPHVGMIIDPFDYAPIIGATVMINGIPRAIAGTSGKCLPSHIPLGGVFVKPPASENEMFMGSSTVSFDGDAASYMALMNLSCHDVGMPPIPRIKKKSVTKSLVLPTSVVLPVPGGPPVLIGGAPTISLMAIGMKVGMAALGKGLKRLAKTRAFRRLMKKFRRARRRLFRKMKSGFIKCKILRAEPVDVITGEVVVEQQDFSIPGRIPLEWTRCYGSHSTRIGACGYGWDTPADARLELELDGSVTFYDGQPDATGFDNLPVNGKVLDRVDGAELDQADGSLFVRTKSGLIYYFEKLENNKKELLVTRVQDLCGNYLEYARKDSRLVEIRESAGRRIKVDSLNGFIEKLHFIHPDWPEPRLMARFEYNDSGDLITVYDALNAPYRFEYNNHCLIRHTNRNGLSFYYEYDEYTSEGRCLHAYGDGGLYNYHFKFLDELNRTEITNSLGHLFTVRFNNFNLIDMEIDPLGGVTKYEYEEVGRTTAVEDPAGNRTEYKYDERGNLVALTRPDGKAIVTEFNEQNKAVSITDPNGATWQQEWDARGLLTRQITPLGAESTYEYDTCGQLVDFTNPLKARTVLAFDSSGNLSRLTDALGHTTAFTYDALGNVSAKTDPLDKSTLYAYDTKGRLTQAVLPSGAAIACAYDAEDNLISYEDENGAVTRLEYCGLGEIKRRLQPDGHTVEYHYDTEERLIGVTNQRGERYELKRDPLGYIVEEIDYWGQARKYSYNSAGHLKESSDPLNRTIQYEADPLGRITKKLLPDTLKPLKLLEETFEYDANGNLIACENAAIRIERQFDPEGRLLKENQGKTCVVSNTYDLNGNRTSRTTEIEVGGRMRTNTVHYNYDALDQAIEVKVEGHAPIKLTRNALGQVTHESLSSKLWRNFSYNANGYLTAQQVQAAEEPLFGQIYNYDHAGNLIEKNDSAFGVDKFTYDPLGRLTAHLNPQGKLIRYLNDPAGDRLKTRVVMNSRESSDSNQWGREGKYDGTFYRFDRAGNLIKRAGPEGDVQFTWDTNQRLITSTVNGRTTTYRYDSLGRRICKETGGQCTHFFWDGDALLGDVPSEEGKDNKPAPARLREWIYYPETFEPLAMLRINGYVTADEKTVLDLYLYHNDPNGCPTRLLDTQGKVVWAARYTAWGGVEKVLTERVENPIRLQGQYEDGETGLHHNRYRYYDFITGLFVTQDPLGLLVGENSYLIARNVFGWFDPLGLACKKKVKALLEGKDVWVKSIKEADELLGEALPNAKKVKGAGPKKPDFSKFKGVDPNGMYHKDYLFDPDTGRIFGHGVDNPHGANKHINVKLPSGDKATIFIKK